jgi:hypothetical protein
MLELDGKPPKVFQIVLREQSVTYLGYSNARRNLMTLQRLKIVNNVPVTRRKYKLFKN